MATNVIFKQLLDEIATLNEYTDRIARGGASAEDLERALGDAAWLAQHLTQAYTTMKNEVAPNSFSVALGRGVSLTWDLSTKK